MEDKDRQQKPIRICVAEPESRMKKKQKKTDNLGEIEGKEMKKRRWVTLIQTEWFTYITTHLKFSCNVMVNSEDACLPIIVSYGVKGNKDQNENANHEQ